MFVCGVAGNRVVGKYRVGNHLPSFSSVIVAATSEDGKGDKFDRAGFC